MKKIVTAGMAGALVLFLAACGDDDGGGATAEGDGGYEVVYVQGVTGNPFFTSVTCGAEAAATDLGVDFDYQGGKDYSAEAQTPILQAVIAQQPDGIIVSPMAGEAMMPTLTEAQSAGIELVFVDTTASDQSLAASFVASDNVEGGRFAAEQTAELVGGSGKVLVLGATPGISTTDARVEGFVETMESEYPDIEVLETQYSGSTPAGATDKLSAVLSANPDLAAVFAVSTQEVEGAIVALEQADAVGTVQLVGFDTSDPIVEAIEAGSVQGVVVQKPLDMGRQAMEQMVKALDGEATEAQIETDYVFLTAATLEDEDVTQYIYRNEC
ncbi:ABC transporter substrate-binding protein [Jiangella muralis]|uniref:ABC transporter substrate-binding protein n=1 Tax=Jiangella muralis TaxID=702383 RepID=UPI00069F2526|nr:ABC transporter substrate-binding protein [Jiangella muralis]